MIMTNKQNRGNNSIRALIKTSDKPEHMTIEEYRVDTVEKLRSKYKADENTDINITIVDK